MPLGMEEGLNPGDFVLDGDPARPLNFRPMFIIVIVRTLHSCYWFVQVQVLVFYAFYLKKSLIVLSLFQYKYAMHSCTT